MTRCGDYDSSNPVQRSLDLVTAIKVAAYNSHVSCYEYHAPPGLHHPPGLGRDDGDLHRAELHGVQRAGGDEQGEAGRRAGEVTTVQHCTACTVHCTLYTVQTRGGHLAPRHPRPHGAAAGRGGGAPLVPGQEGGAGYNVVSTKNILLFRSTQSSLSSSLHSSTGMRASVGFRLNIFVRYLTDNIF